MLREKVLYYSAKEKEEVSSKELPSEEILEKSIEEIRKWLKKQPHLPQNEERCWLRTILILTKFNVEKAKQKLESLYTARTLCPIFFQNRSPLNPNFQNLLKSVTVCPLPKLNNDLCRVHVFKFLSEVDLFDNEFYGKYVFITLDLRCGFNEEYNLGEHYILDYSTAKMSHLLKTNPFLLRTALNIIKNSYAERIKGLHIINIPTYATSTVSLIISLLSDKLKQRIHMHEDLQSLHKIISTEILPVDYGGLERPLDELNENWIKYIESAADWLENEEGRKSNEALRPKWAPLDPELYGIEGSFKKLEVD